MFVLPTAQAGSADSHTSRNQVQWTASHGQRSNVPQSAGSLRLKWKQTTAAAPRRFAADGEAVSAGPVLSDPQVDTALHEENAATDSGEIQLISFDEPADDPLLDPFQDEVYEEDDDGEDGEMLDEEGDDGFDAEEIAQRPIDGELPELPDDLKMHMRELESQTPLGGEIAQAGPGEPERCPSPRDLKPIGQISHRIAAEPGLFPQECALSDYPFQPRNWTPVTFTWKASVLCHKPLYFQQPKLERYGHTFGLLTPIIAVGHFFVMVPCLPYNMGLEPPWECVYPLGWYRPGDCAPYTLGPLPLSLRGAVNQGVITTGLWFLFP